MARHPFEQNARLTQVSLAVQNRQFVADRALPAMPVFSEVFKYTKFNEDERFTPVSDALGRKSAPNQVEFSSSLVEASVNAYGLSDAVPLQDVEAAKQEGLGYDPLGEATEGVTELILLRKEMRAATLYNTLANYLSTQRTTLSGEGQWSHAAAKPLQVLRAAKANMLIQPNTLVINDVVELALTGNPSLVEATSRSGTDQGIAPLEEIARLLGISQVIVGAAVVNTAKKGQTAVKQRVWGNHATLCYLAPLTSARRQTPVFGVTAELGTRSTRTVIDMGRGTHGVEDVIVVYQAKELIVHPAAAYHFHDAAAEPT